jgi:hypothetical protein
MMTVLRTAYQASLPEGIRKRLYKLRRRTPRRLHDLRWTVGRRDDLVRWSDRRLALGPWYWLFVLGCNNSGTTLLMELLEKHPLIRRLPKEGQRLTSAIPNSAPLGIGRVFSQRADLFRWTEETDGAAVPRLRYDWAYYADARPGIRLEKSPPNTLRSRWLQRHFAPARFIVLVRDPYAVCEGIARRRGHSLVEAARHWRFVHEVLEEDLPHLDRYVTVSYEEFCERPEDVLSRLESFLDLPVPFDRALVGGSFNAHNIDGTPQRLQNFNDRSYQRLSREDLTAIGGAIGDVMTRWGYVVR